MPSRVVTRQHDRSALIASAAKKNADAVSAALNARLASHFQKANLPEIDWKPILEVVGQFMLDSGKTLLERDGDLQLRRRLERQLRDRRDLAAEQIRKQLRGVRFLIDQAFGKEKARLLFPARAELSNLDPRNLLRVAKEIIELLQGSGIVWPTVEQLGYAPPPAQLIAALEQSIPALDLALDDLRPEKRGAEFALGTRQMDLDLTVDAMQRGGDCLYGLFRFAGFDFAADRLRPRRRRKAKDGGGSEGEETEAMTPPEEPQKITAKLKPVKGLLKPGAEATTADN